MQTAELELLPREGEAAAPAPRTEVATAAAASIDIASINLTDLALAKFGNWRDATKTVKAEFESLVLDLSTQSKIDDAIRLRNRKLRQPLADARKVHEALKSKLSAVSKAVGAELPLIEAAWADVGTAITPRIEAAQKAIDDKKEVDRLAEQQRLQSLRNKVDEILGQWVDHCKIEGITAERIGNGIAALRDIDAPANLADAHAYWDTRKAETIASMQALQLDAQRADNAREAERLAAESAALAQQRQELEAAQARAAATPAAAAGADPTDTGARKAENPAQEREAAQDQRSEMAVSRSAGLHSQESACSTQAGRQDVPALGGAAMRGAGSAEDSEDLPGVAPGPLHQPAVCQGPNCGAIDGMPHSAECDAAAAVARVSLNLADLEPAGDGPLETGEADAIMPPPAAVQQAMAYTMAECVLASPIELQKRLDAAHDLLRDALKLTEHLSQAWKSRFPSQPKMGQEWWATAREGVADLQPRLLLALAQERQS